MVFLVDSHCHLQMLDLTAENGDLSRVIQRATAQGVHYILNVSVNFKAFPVMVEMSKKYLNIGISVGVHPNERDEKVDDETLLQLGNQPAVIAVGETGLDYFRSTGDLTWQQERFRIHIRAAKQLKKPLIVHTRQAKEDTIRIMQEERANDVSGVMHCFTEDGLMAKQALDMGFYISFSGVVTFKNAGAIREVAKQIPLDRLLIETDAPYLAPEPHRGKPNEPSFIRYTAEYLAELHHISLEEFADQTSNNFFTLFTGAVKPHV
ncbi:MAG TPA: TatD family hydrolase [Gammaproteobacteria bacterium]|nr:TatD family hydrolase [Gammaproteobacteria bacterium]